MAEFERPQIGFLKRGRDPKDVRIQGLGFKV